MVTNDIYTKEDQRILTEAGALAPERIVGVETGGCPHTAIREDASMNLAAVEALSEKFGNLDLIFVESGGDNLERHLQPGAGGSGPSTSSMWPKGRRSRAKADRGSPNPISW